jgi:hypothetical protein
MICHVCHKDTKVVIATFDKATGKVQRLCPACDSKQRPPPDEAGVNHYGKSKGVDTQA